MRVFAVTVVLALLVFGAPVSAAPADGGTVTVGTKSVGGKTVQIFRDRLGREVVLRGFNVSGTTKLNEHGRLPFASVADAARSATAMRDLTGANAIRFLVGWDGVQPAPNTVDTAYLDRAAAQIREFTRRGVHVLVDFHQDLFSRDLFDKDSWYTGNGAPKWVIEAGKYPKEHCVACVTWGQNQWQNDAVRSAFRDFWLNRKLETPAGLIGMQDAFLDQAAATMRHLRNSLPTREFGLILGLDPFNEPADGEGSISSADREKELIWPFYQRVRARMDTAGWQDKPLYAEPLVNWNLAIVGLRRGGFGTIGTMGPRYVFNAHFYDTLRLSVDPTKPGDGGYANQTNEIRDRAAQLGTTSFLSEFGHRMTGWSAEKAPMILKSAYQGLDRGAGNDSWWARPIAAGAVMSATQWQWDIYNGKHRELMNGNPDKVLTAGDAWNDEDHSVVDTDAGGAVRFRVDQRVLDRMYPSAVAGDTLAFAYEDMAKDGFAGSKAPSVRWMKVPAQYPALAKVVENRQFGILAWRGGASGATELHLPRTFDPANSSVAASFGVHSGLSTSDAVVRVQNEEGSSVARKLVVDAGAGVHVALVVNARVPVADLTAAQRDLAAWVSAAGLS
ncbi:cellulase family glycosylhydrolase [Allokutzneria albata]|uniref:Cellulase (Glycosyl hydrolase family 5) n=1 Tax=Allokutzneria albata TaxID=211114 RepID=A0A1H0BWB7_ALLAB|nr:cellulase family glycosylhydrolase [Allokutzneria albata]SDN49924.1 Cellulase (glycosyl hydrolase family 5) [Allokutzneria albata]